ncbi:hypothetical protein Cgig2_016550 [Carnegiea gigantea]|uniref:Uncharacterized protein n=1 Tax=Carnegiea gigantea TaxID=171969 RepID=A0A9Q1KYD5_9CARY|nr:hypothetical protein Cgig2_016550 [Carnegiea gigantea]
MVGSGKISKNITNIWGRLICLGKPIVRMDSFNPMKTLVENDRQPFKGCCGKKYLGLEDIVDAELEDGEVRETIAVQANSNSVQKKKKKANEGFIDSTNSITRNRTTNFSRYGYSVEIFKITQHLKPLGLVLENKHAKNRPSGFGKSVGDHFNHEEASSRTLEMIQHHWKKARFKERSILKNYSGLQAWKENIAYTPEELARNFQSISISRRVAHPWLGEGDFSIAKDSIPVLLHAGVVQEIGHCGLAYQNPMPRQSSFKSHSPVFRAFAASFRCHASITRLHNPSSSSSGLPQQQNPSAQPFSLLQPLVLFILALGHLLLLFLEICIQPGLTRALSNLSYTLFVLSRSPTTIHGCSDGGSSTISSFPKSSLVAEKPGACIAMSTTSGSVVFKFY